MVINTRPHAGDYSGSFIAALPRPRPSARQPPDWTTVSHRLQRARRTGTESLREDGAIGFAWRAVAVAGLRRLTVYELRREDVAARGPLVPGTHVTRLSRRDVGAYLAMRPDALESEVTKRLDGGAECIAAWKNGRLVAARWLRTDRIELPYLGILVSLPPDVAYAYDAYTKPEERRRGVSAMVTAELVEHAVRGGATFIINAVLPENREGSGLARGRSRRLGMVRSVRLGRWLLVQSRVPSGFLGAPAALPAQG